MLLIQNGYMIDPKSGREGNFDILIDGERIVKIGKSLSPPDGKCNVINAEGLLVAPGLIDVHVHFREPGFTEKEDIVTGAAAAAKGGFTTVVMMANTKPAIDTPQVLKEVLNKARKTGIHVLSCGNVTKGMKGQELAPMKDLAEAGAVGFTDDGVPLLDEKTVRTAMKMALELDMPLSFHEEDPKLIENNGINRGKASTYYRIGGSPREAEISLIERDLKLALETGACINIQHISTKEGVELVRKAKRNGSNIHAEATPHHFTLTEEAAVQYGTLAKMNPPLREEEDRQEIIRGLTDDTIDIIATDHAPHTAEEKAKPITEAPSGIIGLETALALGITELVDANKMTMMSFLKKLTCNPAGMYHLNAGYLAEEGPADIVLFDPKEEWVVEEFVSKSANSPFLGWKLKGVVKYTLCGGKVVYQNENQK